MWMKMWMKMWMWKRGSASLGMPFIKGDVVYGCHALFAKASGDAHSRYPLALLAVGTNKQ